MDSSFNMKSAWASIMDETKIPLRNQSLSTAHLLMQMLPWMWSAIFSLIIGSYFVFGVTAAAHMLPIGGLFVTLIVIRKAEATDLDDYKVRCAYKRPGGPPSSVSPGN